MCLLGHFSFYINNVFFVSCSLAVLEIRQFAHLQRLVSACFFFFFFGESHQIIADEMGKRK